MTTIPSIEVLLVRLGVSSRSFNFAFILSSHSLNGERPQETYSFCNDVRASHLADRVLKGFQRYFCLLHIERIGATAVFFSKTGNQSRISQTKKNEGDAV